MQTTDQSLTTFVVGRERGLISEASLLWPAWMSNTGWQVHAPFLFWLIDAVRPRTVVELESGDEAFWLTLSQAVESFVPSGKCFAVLPQTNGARAPERVPSVNAAAYECMPPALTGGSTEALRHFADGTVDLLCISGELALDSVASTGAWLNKLSPQGIVVVLGTSNPERYPAARQVSDFLRARYPVFTFDHGDGLTAVSVGVAQSEVLRKLFELGPEASHLVQAAYARLGEAANWRSDAAAQRQQAARLQRLLKEQAKRQAQLEIDLASTRKVMWNLRADVARAEQMAHAMIHSTSWRVSAPVRVIGRQFNRIRMNPRQLRFFAGLVYRSVRSVGLAETIRKIRRRISDLNGIVGAPTIVGRHIDPARMPAPSRPAAAVLALRVLLIAEVSLSQCLKYRVKQKQKMIQSLGIDCTVVKWSDYEACYESLQTHAIVIFYRVPGYQDVLDVIETARKLGVKTFWEVDDLIFDIDRYRANKNLDHLTAELRNEVLSGVPLYLAALQACDAGIASTTGLAQAMRNVGVKETWVIENGYDDETLELARTLTSSKNGTAAHDVANSAGPVRIVYGSGSKAHDADFLEAAQGLLEVLCRYPNAELHIAGELNLPESFDVVADRIFRTPAASYPDYMKWLSSGDINIAPMEKTDFNDAKSNIKYLEAASLRIPSVCSPCAAFSDAIVDGENGFLADSASGWSDALALLIEDPALRTRVGEAAWNHAFGHYSRESLTRQQIMPFLESVKRPGPRLSILAVNIFYAPRSFGGATIIAEEMAKRLCRIEGVRYSMFTTATLDTVRPYQTVRYESDGVTVFGVGLPSHLPKGTDFENHEMNEPFIQALRAVRPDIVHVHCVQGIGATIVDICKREGVPVAVTLHDAWWICARQFMVTGDNRYCNQVKIDLDVCARCLNDDGSNPYRQHRLAGILQSADLLLTPSAFFRDLYIANGFDPAKILVNKNGVLRPAPVRGPRPPAARGKVRFGFLGGIGPIKGYNLIKKVFSDLPRSDYELVLVDNALNAGFITIRESDWDIAGTLKVMPAFTQATIDDFFGSIDVLLFPTQWKESFGLAVREALVRDVWVIATRGGGVVEDITAGVNGDIIPLEDDGTELRKSILNALDNQGRFETYRNPLAGDIRLFDSQASELYEILEAAVGQAGEQHEHMDLDMPVQKAVPRS